MTTRGCVYTCYTMTQDRKQINFRADDEVEAAIQELQKLPVPGRAPSASEIIRQSILEKRDRARAEAHAKVAAE